MSLHFDLNGDDEVTAIDLEWMRFAIKLDINSDTYLNDADITAIESQPIDVDGNGVADSSDSTLVSDAISAILANAPDLVVDSISVQTDSDWVQETELFPNQTFILKIIIKNEGDAYAPIDYHWQRSLVNPDSEVATSEVISKEKFRYTGYIERQNNEPIHQGYELITLIAPADPGTYHYRICVDSVENKSNPDNNCSNAVKITIGHGDTQAYVPPLRLGDSHSGKIQTPGEVDYFKVDIIADGQLTLYTAGSLDTSGELFQSDISVKDEDSGEDTNFQIQHNVSPGTYYIKVTGAGNSTGGYTIQANFNSPQPCYRPKVRVIWYHASNEKLRGPEAPLNRVLATDYISPDNVQQNLKAVQDFFTRELGSQTFEFVTSPNSNDIDVKYIQSDNFFTEFVEGREVDNSGNSYDDDNLDHFIDSDEDIDEDVFFNKVWEDITVNHLTVPNPLKNIYLVLVQSNHGYLGYDTGTRGMVNKMGGRIAMAALGPFVAAASNETIRITIAHELGHNFGLIHDFVEEGHIMSYNFEEAGASTRPTGRHDRLYSNWFSERSKNWLKVHPAFNNYTSCFKDTPINIAVRDASQTSQTPIILANGQHTTLGSNSGHDITLSANSDGEYKIHFDIEDLDGLHHLELIAPSLKHYDGCGTETCSPGGDYSLAGYLSADASDNEAWDTFSKDATRWAGNIDITEWVTESQDREENNFEIHIATIDKVGNILYFDNLSVIHTPGTAPAPLAQKHLPKETALLVNYPNPFNPETWIPYQLSEPADVTLTIHDIQGRVVRDLDLGHQHAGIYHSRARAAFWDGRNALGEPVASGVYFYTLKAGDFSATRKMLIRK